MGGIDRDAIRPAHFCGERIPGTDFCSTARRAKRRTVSTFGSCGNVLRCACGTRRVPLAFTNNWCELSKLKAHCETRHMTDVLSRLPNFNKEKRSGVADLLRMLFLWKWLGQMSLVRF